jgi:hypothetical protein
MPDNIKDEDLRSILAFAKTTSGGGTIKTNTAVWYNLNQEATSTDPEIQDMFANKNLLLHANDLSTADLQGLAKLQQEIKQVRAGHSPPTSYLTNEALYKSAFVDMGIGSTKSSDKDKRATITAAFASALDREDRERKAAGKPPMSPTEKQAVISDMSTAIIERRGDDVEITPFKDLSQEEIADTTSAISAINVEIDARTVDAASILMEQGLDVTVENIRAVANLRRDGRQTRETEIELWKEAYRSGTNN